jgi:hypothetical protein
MAVALFDVASWDPSELTMSHEKAPPKAGLMEECVVERADAALLSTG